MLDFREMLAGCALCVLLACSSARPRAGTGEGSAPGSSEGPLVVGSDLDNAPFAWIEERGPSSAGRPVGRDVDMMEELARMLGRGLEWRRMPFEELLPAVERGEVDVLCATLGISPERAERVRFTRPYFTTRLAVVVRAGPGEPLALAELEGRRVGGGSGTTAERAIRAELPGAVGVFENKSGLPGLERLLGHELDALVMDGPAADALVDASGSRLRVLAEDLGPERYALVVHPGARELERALSRALDELERGGRLATLDRIHGLEP